MQSPTTPKNISGTHSGFVLWSHKSFQVMMVRKWVLCQLIDNGWKLYPSDDCPVFYLWTIEREETHQYLLILLNECYRVEKVNQ